MQRLFQHLRATWSSEIQGKACVFFKYLRSLKEPNAATWSAKAFKGMGAFECHRATRGLADVRDNMAAFNGVLAHQICQGVLAPIEF